MPIPLLLLIFTAAVATFPRHPDPSPDGSRIAFSYAGDIWTVAASDGEAIRLTTHPGYEHTPRWSPDGRWLAFSADREDNDDIYIIPSDGGASRRLTFIDADDQVCDWTPDSHFIIFSSRRNDQYPNLSRLYRVSIDGGTPEPLMDSPGEDAAISRDGATILYNRGDFPWWQRHYRGSGADQIWLYNLSTRAFTPVTDTTAHQTGDDYLQPASQWAFWGSNGSIYLVTDRDGAPNLWRKNPFDAWQQITHYTDDGVRFPAASRDGRLIAFEHGLDIYTLTDGGEPRKLEIIAPDDPAAGVEIQRYSDRADRLAFTPDGRQMFLEIRGEVFASRIVGDDDEAARGRANNLSEPISSRTDIPVCPSSRDGDFTVSPGGDSLVFISDRAGNRDLFLVTSADPDTRELSRALRLKLEQMTTDSADEYSPQYSPDGSQLAFVRGKGDLYIMDVKTRAERCLIAGWSMLSYAWSPDGKWLAYTREDDDYNSDVWVIPAGGGAACNISRHPDEDELPVWSADGRKLAFRSRRRDNNWDIYFVFLRLADYQKTDADWAEETRQKSARKDDGGKKDNKDKEKKSKPEPVIVQIDTTDIHLRVRAVTSLAGEEGVFAISPDGERYALVSNHEGEADLYTVKWTGKDIKRLTTGGASPRFISFSKDSDDVRFLTGRGQTKSVTVKNGKDKDLPFNATLTVNPLAERRQKFGEIWRTLNDEFYDPAFHGQDWAALGKKYGALIDAASCENDFADLVRMMFGELNSSHMGYYPPDNKNSPPSGLPGVDFDFTQPGPGLTVKYVLPNGPCDREDARLHPGDRITSIVGLELTPSINLDSLLTDRVRQRVELVVARGKEQLRFIIRPLPRNEIGDLRYDDWVRQRRAFVDSLSANRFGYLHIRGMGEESLTRFETELYSVGAGKDGLVIDVRFNGGGWTTDWLLAMLQVKRHAVTFPRDGGPGYPQSRLPLYSWTKPITVLCNEHSFSNAEIFSHAIKTLGRGALVGVPTPGGVISTGEHPLLDGSSFRVPLRGWYVGSAPTPDPARGMEGNGAVPDLIVPLAPNQLSATDDTQLRSAVNGLLLKTR